MVEGAQSLQIKGESQILKQKTTGGNLILICIAHIFLAPLVFRNIERHSSEFLVKLHAAQNRQTEKPMLIWQSSIWLQEKNTLRH